MSQLAVKIPCPKMYLQNWGIFESKDVTKSPNDAWVLFAAYFGFADRMCSLLFYVLNRLVKIRPTCAAPGQNLHCNDS